MSNSVTLRLLNWCMYAERERQREGEGDREGERRGEGGGVERGSRLDATLIMQMIES